jgi:CRISPR-associated protein Cas2
MRVIVSYDVETTTREGRRRLRGIAKACKGYGVRVQYSVFECSVGPSQIVLLRAALLALIDPARDSLRMWYLSEDDARKTEHHGVREPVDMDGPLVV